MHHAKQKKLSFPLSNSNVSHSFELLHMDIWRSYSTISMQDHKYFLTIVDNPTRYIWTILMILKTETRSHIIHFVTQVEKHFNTFSKTICIDNGVKFSKHDYFFSRDIIHQTTCIETLEQNDIVKCKHQRLLNVTRALLFQSHLH